MQRYIGGDAASARDRHHASDQPAVPHRRGYDLDYDRLFETAVETGRSLEIDGAPAHLDLDGALARRAVAAGATVAIDSDCHRAELLDRQMQLGLLTARRGWVEARHVLNTRPLAEVRAAHRAQARRLIGGRRACANDRSRSCWRPSSPRAPSRSTAPPCCRASTSATPPRSRPWSGAPPSRRATAIRCTSRSAGCPPARRGEPAHALNLASASKARSRAGSIALLVAAELSRLGAGGSRCGAAVRRLPTRSGASRSSRRSTRCTCCSSR